MYDKNILQLNLTEGQVNDLQLALVVFECMIVMKPDDFLRMVSDLPEPALEAVKSAVTLATSQAEVSEIVVRPLSREEFGRAFFDVIRRLTEMGKLLSEWQMSNVIRAELEG